MCYSKLSKEKKKICNYCKIDPIVSFSLKIKMFGLIKLQIVSKNFVNETTETFSICIM